MFIPVVMYAVLYVGYRYCACFAILHGVQPCHILLQKTEVEMPL